MDVKKVELALSRVDKLAESSGERTAELMTLAQTARFIRDLRVALREGDWDTVCESMHRAALLHLIPSVADEVHAAAELYEDHTIITTIEIALESGSGCVSCCVMLCHVVSCCVVGACGVEST